MTAKSKSYKPAHSEEVVTTMSAAEFDVLISRLISAGCTQASSNETQNSPGLADTHSFVSTLGETRRDAKLVK
jgi:hypothetical protein